MKAYQRISGSITDTIDGLWYSSFQCFQPPSFLLSLHPGLALRRGREEGGIAFAH